ncbi:MAG: hypothetical protein AB8B71_00075 [Paracoccaceae bacterium]
MCKTYQCVLEDDAAILSISNKTDSQAMPRDEFDRAINRRQRSKLSTATRIAGTMIEHFKINEKLQEFQCDPANTPVVVCNRFANWDYVSDAMCSDVEVTLDQVNNYVATAWFPATVQGFLTIDNANTGEAITIATKDPDLQSATIASLFPKGKDGVRKGAVIFATFECVPDHIGGRAITGSKTGAFGAITIVRADDSQEEIDDAIQTHLRMYENVAA